MEFSKNPLPLSYPQLKNLFSSLFFQRCARCHAVSSQPICEKCVPKLPFLKPPFCQKCSQPLSTSLAVPLCRPCREHPRRLRFLALRSPFLYREPMRQLLLQLKFGKKTHLASFFGMYCTALLHHPITPFPAVASFDALVPIPTAPARIFQRWFNQADLLAQTISELTHLPTKHLLSRKKCRSSPQSKMPYTLRFANIKGSFSASEKAKGKTLLLIDDVATSSYTLSEAARMLYQKKASAVYALTLCRAART